MKQQKFDVTEVAKKYEQAPYFQDSNYCTSYFVAATSGPKIPPLFCSPLISSSFSHSLETQDRDLSLPPLLGINQGIYSGHTSR